MSKCLSDWANISHSTYLSVRRSVFGGFSVWLSRSQPAETGGKGRDRLCHVSVTGRHDFFHFYWTFLCCQLCLPLCLHTLKKTLWCTPNTVCLYVPLTPFVHNMYYCVLGKWALTESLLWTFFSCELFLVQSTKSMYGSMRESTAMKTTSWTTAVSQCF